MSQGDHSYSGFDSLVLPEDNEHLDDNSQLLYPQIKATLDDLDLEFGHVEADYFNEDDENKPPVPRFGTQVGLFAKFTNNPTLDEFALVNLISQEEGSPRKSPKKKTSGLPLMPIPEEPVAPKVHTLLSFQGSEYDNPDFENIVKKRQKHSALYRASLIAVIFSTQFGIFIFFQNTFSDAFPL